MANTYHQLYIQIIFAVKGRKSFIKESFREELQRYMSGIISGQKQKLYAIYCMPDHTHIFVSINPDIAISDLTRDIKSNSSSFIKEKNFAPEFGWSRLRREFWSILLFKISSQKCGELHFEPTGASQEENVSTGVH